MFEMLHPLNKIVFFYLSQEESVSNGKELHAFVDIVTQSDQQEDCRQ